MATVYLSPSLQEFNVGYGNYGTEEERMNEIADVVESELIGRGVTVYRNTPTQTLAQAVAESNEIYPDIHVAIHSNASSDGSARGPTIYIHRLGGQSEVLANDIYEYLQAISPEEGFGVIESYTAFEGRGYYELKRTIAPSVIIEVAFHDNPADADFIINNIYEIGIAITRGILDYFGISF